MQLGMRDEALPGQPSVAVKRARSIHRSDPWVLSQHIVIVDILLSFTGDCGQVDRNRRAGVPRDIFLEKPTIHIIHRAYNNNFLFFLYKVK